MPVTDNAAVAAGYRHPIHLGSCRGSFPADRLHLFSPRRRDRGVAAAGAGGDRGHRPDSHAGRRASQPGAPRPPAGPIWRCRCGWKPAARSARADGGGADPVESGAVVAAPLLRAAGVGAARATGWRCSSAACWCAASEVLRGDSVRDVVRAGGARRAGAGRDAASPGGVARSCWPSAWARRGGTIVRVSRLARARRCASRARRWSPLEPRVLGAADRRRSPVVTAARSREEPMAEPVEIENRPLGPMPLWGLRRSKPAG